MVLYGERLTSRVWSDGFLTRAIKFLRTLFVSLDILVLPLVTNKLDRIHSVIGSLKAIPMSQDLIWRLNLIRFHGVFAPSSKHRVAVVPATRGKGNRARTVLPS